MPDVLMVHHVSAIAGNSCMCNRIRSQKGDSRRGTHAGRRIMTSLTCFRHRTSFVLVNATLILAMTGVPTYPQHSHVASQPSTSPAWSELQQSMQTMQQTMSSIQSTGSNDEDFIRLMIPHHQAAIDMAKA